MSVAALSATRPSRLRQAFRDHPGSAETDDGTIHCTCKACGQLASLTPDDRVKCDSGCDETTAAEAWLEWAGNRERMPKRTPAKPPEELRAPIADQGEQTVPDRLKSGAAFILDAPEDVPAIWGNGQEVIWAAGESLMIVAPPGLGKTTLGQQLALKRHGIGENRLLGSEVEVDASSVLYIAADRPMQAARSFRRMVGEDDRQALEHFHVWPGPLPFDLGTDPEGLARMAKGMQAGTIFIDSLKDVALDLTTDESGSRVNLAIQTCIAEGIEVAVLHHQRKAGSDNRTPRTLDDVYGSTWLTAGAGSVLLLWGKPGDPIVDLRHLKQPAEEFGPVSIHHDHQRGVSKLHEPSDLIGLAANSPGGLTVEYAAKALFGTNDPDRNQREKARRRLEGLCSEGKLAKRSGSPRHPRSTPRLS